MTKILVIEDDSDLIRNICDILNSEGYETLTAENGKIGLEKAKVSSPNLIISDIMMPEMDGLELLQELQKNPETAAIPFIFLTAKIEMENLRNGMKLGADDYITKPFSIDDLIDSVKTRLTKKVQNDRKIKDLQEQIVLKIPHELRTPLIPILGFTEMIDDENDIEQIKEMVKKIGTSGKKLHEKIEKLIRFSNLIANEKQKNFFRGTSEIRKEIVSHSIKKISKELKPEDRTKIKIEPCLLPIDHVCLETILTELVENGLKFSSDEENVLIEGYRENGYYVLSVTDHGRGMTESEIRSVTAFKKFGENQLAENGLGLGLAIVQKIAKMYGCKFSINSEVNKFTNCRIIISLL